MGLLTLAAAGLLGYGVFVAADHADSAELAYAALGLGAVAPAGVGIAVCQVGGTGKLYDGRCVPAVGGAYIGALSAIPGVLLGMLASCSSSSNGGDDLSGLDACFMWRAPSGAPSATRSARWPALQRLEHLQAPEARHAARGAVLLAPARREGAVVMASGTGRCRPSGRARRAASSRRPRRTRPRSTSPLVWTRNGSSRSPQRARGATSIGPSRNVAGGVDARELVGGGRARLDPADEVLLGRVAHRLPARDRRSPPR